ncbi:hypothetical protein KY362_06350 [Candidatus Woesearchaeota archaeon]|nr:hypothetical protein [Candidatus Woesearchaeota archaeon]
MKLSIEQCSEPNCRHPATKDFHGKKLCEDCFDRYKAEEEKMNAELADSDW